MKRKIKIFLLVIFSVTYLSSLDYTIPPYPYSIQTGDYDNDGDNDIVVGHISNYFYLSIIRNNGSYDFEKMEFQQLLR